MHSMMHSLSTEVAVSPAQHNALLCIARWRNESIDWQEAIHESDILYHHHAPPSVRHLGGRGQRIAIIDIGVQTNSAFWHARMPEPGPATPHTRKLIAEIDTSDANASASSSVLMLRSKLDEQGNASQMCPLGSHMNHPERAIDLGFWRVQAPAIEGARRNSVAHGVQIVSMRFARTLYLSNTPKAQYVASLARALEWVATHASKLAITTVQVSALDGRYDNGPKAYEEAVPYELRRLRQALRQLREQGVWVSAPTGNIENNRSINWPASEPLITAVGCANATSGQPMLARSSLVDVLMPTLLTKPVTSACNTQACSLAVALRQLIRERCGGNGPSDARTVLELMRAAASNVSDAKRPEQTYHVVRPVSTFARVASVPCR